MVEPIDMDMSSLVLSQFQKRFCDYMIHRADEKGKETFVQGRVSAAIQNHIILDWQSQEQESKSHQIVQPFSFKTSLHFSGFDV
ncbi:MAG: hypothetical protein IJW40_11070 [Clostridia bacterium]|nr:hypothetical protein [Clostridia bacterium]